MKLRLASASDKEFFIKDYLNRYGDVQELAEKYAIACISINRSIVLHTEEEIIGAITWSMKEGITSGLVEIFQMTIPNSQNRGKGYGKMMLKECLKDIEGYYIDKNFPLRRIFIVIDEENLAGRNVYKNRGFNVIVELKNHLKSGQKSFVYAKDYFNIK